MFKERVSFLAKTSPSKNAQLPPSAFGVFGCCLCKGTQNVWFRKKNMVYLFFFIQRKKDVFFRRSPGINHPDAVILSAPHIVVRSGAIRGATTTNSFHCDAHDLLPFAPLWSSEVACRANPSFGSCRFSVFLHGLRLFFAFTFVSANGFQGEKQYIWTSKRHGLKKTPAPGQKIADLQVKKKGTTTAWCWNSCGRINGLASRRWLA